MLSIKTPESMVPRDYPIREVKRVADLALRQLSPLFDEMYATSGRASIPPEVLLKSMLLIALFSIRSERLLCEQLGYNMLYRWFLDMDLEDEPFDHSTFSKNRERLLAHEVAHQFLRAIVQQARLNKLVSSEHFSVDGTLIEAWASMKSFRPKDEDDDDNDGNGWADFRGSKRSNATHESKTDPEAKLMRKGKGREAKLSYCMNVLMENRSGLAVGVEVEEATGWAEREAALVLIARELPGGRRITLGGDKGYDTRDFAAACRERNTTPHVAQNINANRKSAIDRRTTRHPGYRASAVVRRRIEPVIGWMKNIAGAKKTRFRGRKRTDFWGQIAGCAYNLVRMARLSTAA